MGDFAKNVVQLVVREADIVSITGTREDLASLDVPVDHTIRVEVVKGLEEPEGAPGGDGVVNRLDVVDLHDVLDALALVERSDKDEHRPLDKDPFVADDAFVASGLEAVCKFAFVFAFRDGDVAA